MYKKIIIIGIILIIGILVYSTNNEYKYDIKSDKIIAYVNGKRTGDIPGKNDGYVVDKIECDNDATTSWNNESWGILIKNLSDSDTKCSVYFKNADYTITYDGNGGTPSKASDTVAHNGTISNLPTATRSGHTFAGWWTESSGGTQISSNTQFTSSQTIYAHWDVTDGPSLVFNNGTSNWGGFVYDKKLLENSAYTISETIDTKLSCNVNVTSTGKTAALWIKTNDSYSLRNWNKITFDYSYINYSGGYEIAYITVFAITEESSNNYVSIGSERIIYASNGKASNKSGTLTFNISDAIKDLENVKIGIGYSFMNVQNAKIEINNMRLTT